MTKQGPLFSLEAEQAVIGALLINNEAWDAVSTVVNESDFQIPEHRIVMSTIRHMLDRFMPVDIITIISELENKKELQKAGGESYIYEIANNTASIANIRAYASIVREQSIKKQILSICRDIADTVYNPEGRTTSEILDELESRVYRLSKSKENNAVLTSIQTALFKVADILQKTQEKNTEITGIETGFHEFDKMTSGLQNSDLLILAARPGMGKTSFAMNIVENITTKNKDAVVLVFSLEMPPEQILMRMLSSAGHIELSRIKSGKLTDDDCDRFITATNRLQNSKIIFYSGRSLTTSDLRTYSRRVAREFGHPSLIVIDYLQLMNVAGYKGDNRTVVISEISRSLKSLAMEMNIPVIALSQLNRSLEQRFDKRPVMSDLRESGSLEQDADIICFIYRDEIYNKNTLDKGFADIIIAKHRNGPTGEFRTRFEGQFTRFADISTNG